MHSLEYLIAVMKWNSYIKLRRIVRLRALIGNNKHVCLFIDVFPQPMGSDCSSPLCYQRCLRQKLCQSYWFPTSLDITTMHILQSRFNQWFSFPDIFLVSMRSDFSNDSCEAEKSIGFIMKKNVFFRVYIKWTGQLQSPVWFMVNWEQ